MKVYVDELPKCCEKCQFCDKDNGICQMLGQYFRDGYNYTDCPLQSLTDYTKQVSREVVEKIKKHIDTQLDFYNTELDEDDDNYAVGYIGGLKWVKDVLDLMEGEYK